MKRLILSRDLLPLIGRILCKLGRIQNTLQQDCAVTNWKIDIFTHYHSSFLLKLGTKFLVFN